MGKKNSNGRRDEIVERRKHAFFSGYGAAHMVSNGLLRPRSLILRLGDSLYTAGFNTYFWNVCNGQDEGTAPESYVSGAVRNFGRYIKSAMKPFRRFGKDI